jgi:ribulose-phosphate 3-epimerase
MFDILPSILNSDFWNIKETLNALNKSEIKEVHIDIMDGNFVEDMAFGPKFVKTLREHTELKLDLHLMVMNPERKIEKFIEAGADSITFNVESTFNVMNIIQEVKEHNKKVGVAISPHTSISSIEAILPFVDQVLVLTIKPGTLNSKIITEMYDKIKELYEIKIRKEYSYRIMVDGKVDDKTLRPILESGADSVVSGGYIFKNEKVLDNIETLRKIGIKYE